VVLAEAVLVPLPIVGFVESRLHQLLEKTFHNWMFRGQSVCQSSLQDLMDISLSRTYDKVWHSVLCKIRQSAYS